MPGHTIDEQEYQELKHRRKRLAEKQSAVRRFYVIVGVAFVFQLGVVGGILLSSRGAKYIQSKKTGTTVAMGQPSVPAQAPPVPTAARTAEARRVDSAPPSPGKKEFHPSKAHERRKQPVRIRQRKVKEAPPAAETRPAIAARFRSSANVVPAASDLLHSYAAGVRAIVARHKEYPVTTGKSFAGRCLIICIINRDGTLKHAEIIKSSGNPYLDRAAVRSVKNAGKFPKIPDAIAGNEFSFDVPVTFNIPG